MAGGTSSWYKYVKFMPDALNVCQASPHDPENFPFVVLGNKIDMEESKRMVWSDSPA